MKPYRLAPEGMRGMRARVTGEHGVYEAAAWYDARGRLMYSCDCDYCSVHPVRRDCSHALAVAKLI